MLTLGQLQALRAYIEADASLNAQPSTPDGAFAIALALNVAASPDYYVWRTSVRQDEITQNGFAWVEVDNLSVGKARIWEWLFLNDTRSINPSKPNVRAGIAECWSGTANRVAVQAVVLGHCKRLATRFEQALATGNGAQATPSTMGAEGPVDFETVLLARAA